MDKNHLTSEHDYTVEIKEAAAIESMVFGAMPINFFKHIFDKWICSTYAEPFFEEAYDACQGIISIIIKNKEKVAKSICTFYNENRIPGYIMA